MARILVTEKINPAGIRLMEQAGHTVFEPEARTEEAILKAMKQADGALVRIFPITAAMMEACPDLKILSKHGVGIDNFDLEAAKRLGIAITTAPGANARSVAEHSITLMLTLAKNVIPISQGYKEKGFSVKTSMEGVEVYGKTLGIIGCGNIGRMVAGIAALGLGMRVLVYDPYISEVPAGCERTEDIHEIYRRSDFITVHCYLSPETEHLVDEAAFAEMKPQVIFINCARGPIVEEQALIRALQEKRIAGAGLDVTEEEPLPSDHPLFRMQNVIVTPHYAPTTREAAVGVSVMAAENLVRFFDGRELIGRIV